MTKPGTTVAHKQVLLFDEGGRMSIEEGGVADLQTMVMSPHPRSMSPDNAGYMVYDVYKRGELSRVVSGVRHVYPTLEWDGTYRRPRP